MKRFLNSLTFRIGTIIILIEIVILAVIGFIYIRQFTMEIDERVKARVELPGILIDQNLMTVLAVTDEEMMTDLVGEELIDGMVVDYLEKFVFFAMDSSHAQQNIVDIPGIDPGWFEVDRTQPLLEETSDGWVSVTNINDLYYVYVKVGNKQAEIEKRRIVVLFVGGSIIAVALTSMVIILLFNSIISIRINKLLDVLRRVTSGELGARVEGKISSDQIGILQNEVNIMAGQLQQTIETLEEQVVERTRGLETVVETSQRLTGILELSDLLNQVVTLTKETFAYYHAHIYLLDEQSQTLRLVEGYGQAGAEMKRRGHNISLTAPRSLVARAAREKQCIVVEDVQNDPTWLPNSLLPDTRSEMAVPVMSGQEVVGVLDVQSEKVGGLTPEDDILLQPLANQVAVAVRNAHIFAQTQKALEQAQRIQRLYTGQAWEKFSVFRPTTDYEVRQPALPSLQNIATPEAITALQHKQTVDLRIGGSEGDGANLSPTGSPEEAPDNSAQVESQAVFESALATPLKLGEDIIGVLGIRDDDPDRRWTQEEVALIEAVSEQMSLSLENARLFEETGRRASRERIIAEVTRRVWASGEMEQVMRTAVEQLGQTLDASRVIIRLGTEEQLITLPPEPDNGTEFPD
jgi:GAF domain-containing protein/HAMP domain-containing protein